MSDAQKVYKNIVNIFERRKAAVYGICLEYAAMALEYFQTVQPAKTNSQGMFWHNQTATAALLMHTDAFQQDNLVGWFMAHGVQYGAYLELANNGLHEAIRPIIQRYAGRFFRDVRALFED